MRFILNESTLENIIYEYINNYNYNLLNIKGKIVFQNYDDPELADIKYFVDGKLCIVYIKLVNDISSFFSLDRNESLEYIKKWVQNELNRKVQLIMTKDTPIFI